MRPSEILVPFIREVSEFRIPDEMRSKSRMDLSGLDAVQAAVLITTKNVSKVWNAAESYMFRQTIRTVWTNGSCKDFHKSRSCATCLQSAELITMVNGKQVLLRDGYTYYKKNKSGLLFKWACTASASCKACLRVDDNLYVYHRNPNHNHPKKRFIKTSSGRYIRL